MKDSIHPATRNQHETRNILTTFQVTRSYLEKGEFPEYNHTSRVSENLYITELLLSAISLESYLYGISKHLGIALPKKMPNPDPKGRATRPDLDASLEYKLKYLLEVSKSNLKHVRVYAVKGGKVFKKKLSISLRKQILEFINAEFKYVSKAIKVRNKLAHGETFYALSGSKNKKKHHLSRFIFDINKSTLSTITKALSNFQEFCEILLCDDFKSNSDEGVRRFVRIARLMKRNDFLQLVGMRASPDFTVISNIQVSREVESSLSNKPEAFRNSYGFLHSRIVARSYANKKFKQKSGATKKFLAANKIKKQFTEINFEEVENIFYQNYWERASLSAIADCKSEVAEELFILSVNIGPPNAIKCLQIVLNKISIAAGSRVRLKVNGVVDKKTISLLKKNVSYYKSIIKGLIFLNSFGYFKKNDRVATSLWFQTQDRVIYSSKNKTIDYSLFY